MTEPVPTLNMIWECPTCGLQLGQGVNVTFAPSKCSFWHAPVEMEQRSASRWGRQFEEGDDG